MYKITLPYPPSVNALFNGGSGQKRFPSKKYKEWLLACPQVFDRPKINIPVKVYYDFYLPDNRIRDIGNYEKAVTDFLVKNEILEDDNFKIIVNVELRFCAVDKENPRVQVKIEKI